MSGVFICCLMLDSLQHRDIHGGGNADPHRCPMTECTDESMVSRFSMSLATEPIHHALVGRGESQSSPSQGGQLGSPLETAVSIQGDTWYRGQSGQRLHAESVECAVVLPGGRRDSQLHVLPSGVRGVHT